eukprot:s5575_g4.t1
MTSLDSQLQEALAELAQFGAMMGPGREHLPALVLPSTRPSLQEEARLGCSEALGSSARLADTETGRLHLGDELRQRIHAVSEGRGISESLERYQQPVLRHDPLERVEAVRLVKTLMQLTACPDIVVKFHALRTQNLASDVIHRLFW